MAIASWRDTGGQSSVQPENGGWCDGNISAVRLNITPPHNNHFTRRQPLVARRAPLWPPQSAPLGLRCSAQWGRAWLNASDGVEGTAPGWEDDAAQPGDRRLT